MYYLTRSCRRADAVRKVYGCCEDIHILESIANVGDNEDNLYEIWDGDGNLVKIAPKKIDFMRFTDGGWAHAPDMTQIKSVNIRDPNSGLCPLYVDRRFPVDWKELGISRPLMKIEIPDREYMVLDRSDVIPEFMREQVYRERAIGQSSERTYDNIISPRVFYQPPQVADIHEFGLDDGRDSEHKQR